MDPRIGRNLPIEEYLALLDQQNKSKKAEEKADNNKNQREEREKGFNVFISGANEERATAQNKKNKAKDSSNLVKASAQVVRRKWEAPQSASSLGRPDDDQYMNPFQTQSKLFKQDSSEIGMNEVASK